jgi:putative transposase
MLDAVRSEVAKGERTWTAPQLADWVATHHGVRLSPGRLRVHLKRAKISWQRTSRSLKHKQDPGEVAETQATLDALETKGAAGLIDLCHLDEVGFAMTLPTTYSWCPQGEQLHVPYQAPQGRRVNAIGAHFTHGPEAGRLEYQSWAVLPKSRAKQPRKTPEERAAAHGLTVDDVGPIDAERVVDFVWQVAGRPEDAPADWQRARPLLIALDNYSVHTSQTIQDASAHWLDANVHLVYLARYCPEQSRIEPVWNDVKQHHLPTRSFERVADLKHAVDDALARKAELLRQTFAKSTNGQQVTT